VELLPPPTPQPMLIHISGAVAAPGVYSLPPGSRVQDAVQAAGGLLSDADESQVNLAAFLEDGQKVHIPAQGAAGDLPSDTRSGEPLPDALVNINTASQAELEALPGIGPSLAQAILAYRQANGAFTSLEGIQAVDGIGPVTYEEIKGLITIGDGP
jgi:competence protein ComEA